MSERAVKPEVVITQWGGKKRSCVSLDYELCCGMFPYCTTKVVLKISAENTAIATSSAKVFKRLGAQQQASFTGKTSPDVTLKATANTPKKYRPGSAKTTLNFSGFSLGDTHTFTVNDTHQRGSAVPTYASVDALCYGIYKDMKPDPFIAKQIPDNIVDIIKYVEKSLRSSFVMTEGVLQSDKVPEETKNTVKKIHERNGQLVPIFHKILENSRQTIGWSKLTQWLPGKAGEELRMRIAEAIQRVLVNNLGNFMNTLISLGGIFQWLYVPHHDSSNPGKFVNKAYLVAGQAESLNLHPVAISAQAANPTAFLPVSHVYVNSAFRSDPNVAGKVEGVNCPTNGPDNGGSQIQSAGPPWWLPDLHPQTEEELRKVQEQGGDTVAVSKLTAAQKKAGEAAKEIAKKSLTICQAWGLCHYAWLSLMNCVADVTIPAVFGLEIGKRYTVKVNNEEIFTGFLLRMDTTLDANSSCLTRLKFSHIMCPGFTLPGADELNSLGMVH